MSISVTPTSRRHRQAVDGGPASAGGDDHEAERATAQALAAIALPPARAEDRATLRRSIEADGVLVPVIVSAGPACRGEVADGKLRVELAAELGRECPSEQRPFTSEAAFRHFRLISNLARRQLGTAARIRLGLALEPWLKAQAAARKAQAVGRPRGEKTVPVALPEEKGETRALVARQVGLKPSTYSRGAKVLREGSPELVAALEAEKESVNSAYRRLCSEDRTRQRLQIAERLQREPPTLPQGRYSVLVLDPPWPYPASTLPYPPMNLEAIAELPVPDLLAEDGIAWLWTTNRFLYDSQQIASARWGLEQRNVVTWVKDDPGVGPWLRGQTEHCLLYTRGKPVFLPGNHSTALKAKGRDHSRKPDEFYELVEATCPGSKLELFARERRDGWHAWGAEPDRFPGVGAEEAA